MYTERKIIVFLSVLTVLLSAVLFVLLAFPRLNVVVSWRTKKQPKETPTVMKVEIPGKPTPSPTPTPPFSVSELEQKLDKAIRDHDRAAIQDVADKAKLISYAVPEASSRLISIANYALDRLSHTYYLSALDYIVLPIKPPDQKASAFLPSDFGIKDDELYFVESGEVYAGKLPPFNEKTHRTIEVKRILKRTDLVGGYPVKEPVFLSVAESKNIYVLDKSGDLYRYDIVHKKWYLEDVKAREYSAPAPLFLNMDTYNGRVYLLDPARNQIWRHPGKGMPIGFLPGILPWKLTKGDVDVGGGVDLAVYRYIYVLNRDGSILKLSPRLESTYSINSLPSPHLNNWSKLPTRPVAIWVDPALSRLFVADVGHRRIVSLDLSNGNVLYQIVAPDNLDFSAIRSILTDHKRLFVLAGSYLYVINIPPNPVPKSTLPEWVEWSPASLARISLDDLKPQDPRVPAILHRYDLIMPISGAMLPDRSAVYPGARRAYRYGVHQGLDLFKQDVGAEVAIGTPVHAVADGVVVRADLNYKRLSLSEMNALLADAKRKHITPPETLDKLGGRQVWIEHGGFLTKYLHLSGISDGIHVGTRVHKGDVIGYVGMSGTPDELKGRTQFVHLHFEIRFGKKANNTRPYYLGQWLGFEQTRYAFEDVFDVPVRPAFVDFRTKK